MRNGGASSGTRSRESRHDDEETRQPRLPIEGRDVRELLRTPARSTSTRARDDRRSPQDPEVTQRARPVRALPFRPSEQLVGVVYVFGESLPVMGPRQTFVSTRKLKSRGAAKIEISRRRENLNAGLFAQRETCWWRMPVIFSASSSVQVLRSALLLLSPPCPFVTFALHHPTNSACTLHSPHDRPPVRRARRTLPGSRQHLAARAPAGATSRRMETLRCRVDRTRRDQRRRVPPSAMAVAERRQVDRPGLDQRQHGRDDDGHHHRQDERREYLAGVFHVAPAASSSSASRTNASAAPATSPP